MVDVTIQTEGRDGVGEPPVHCTSSPSTRLNSSGPFSNLRIVNLPTLLYTRFTDNLRKYFKKVLGLTPKNFKSSILMNKVFSYPLSSLPTLSTNMKKGKQEGPVCTDVNRR